MKAGNKDTKREEIRQESEPKEMAPGLKCEKSPQNTDGRQVMKIHQGQQEACISGKRIESRQKRLEQALRDNLRRRKTQKEARRT